ncbi:MAG: LemA family protein, partial [Solirubrobacteraceae bacterium]
HDVSDAIQSARRIYNAEVRLYLARRTSFPASVLAGLGDFPERPYFELDQTRERPGLLLAPAPAGS